LLIPSLYTGEDLKRLSEAEPLRGVIFNRYRYRAIKELKCPILILQWCKLKFCFHNKCHTTNKKIRKGSKKLEKVKLDGL
jgi:hypothetical protein